MPKKKIIETTGKVESSEPTNLEQIMGFNQLARYHTTEASVYETTLNEMSRVEGRLLFFRLFALLPREFLLLLFWFEFSTSIFVN